MGRSSKLRLALLVISSLAMSTGPHAQQDQQSQASPQAPAPAPATAPGIEPKATELLKAMSSRLAAARTMSFTAISTYESPATNGQPLYYTTISEVTLERPDKLRVITPGDGPPTEFYYNGKFMVAYDPAVNLVAVADAPPTIDAMAKMVYDKAAIYFPFIDFIVADPFKDIGETLKTAFVVGQSNAVGGTLTDMVAIASDTVQAEIWIGANDHLPRMIRAVFPQEPGNKRYETDFSNWRLNAAVAPNDFASPRADKAPRVPFRRPDTEPTQKAGG
jgi:hypothetical protein